MRLSPEHRLLYKINQRKLSTQCLTICVAPTTVRHRSSIYLTYMCDVHMADYVERSQRRGEVNVFEFSSVFVTGFVQRGKLGQQLEGRRGESTVSCQRRGHLVLEGSIVALEGSKINVLGSSR